MKRALSKAVDTNERHLLLHACGGDGELAKRIEPLFHLLRTDSWGEPIIYRAGSFVVTMGQGRRETGTHYTPKSLTEPIVQHTLEPLVYVGPAEGKPQNEWKLKAPADILALKVCDMAMGSAAFLVQACRWMAERLTEVWAEAEAEGKVIGIEGEVLDSPAGVETMPEDRSERLLLARRLIASRCLYGVDINPMAVELAKLSLWLVTMQKNRPFNFLDHALKCGDSLLGVSDIKQLENFSIRAPDTDQPLFDTANLWRHTEQAAELRRKLESLPSHTAEQIAEKARLHAEAEALTTKLKAAADFLVAAELDSPDERTWQNRRVVAASHMQAVWDRNVRDFQALASNALQGVKAFHWAIELPEVFEAGGFDAMVGNPPFLGGTRISYRLGDHYLQCLYRLHPYFGNRADLVSLFFSRSVSLGNDLCIAGLIGTDTIAEGDTREVSLDRILGSGAIVYRAIRSLKWPGTASQRVSIVWFSKSEWKGGCNLDGKIVERISAYLDSQDGAPPERLLVNETLSYEGAKPGATGFVLNPGEASSLKLSEPQSSEVIFPYLRGEDLNSRFDQSPCYFVIDFGDRSLHQASKFEQCMKIVRSRVKPVRDTVKRKAHRERWWTHAELRPGLYRETENLNEVIVHAFTSKHIAFAVVPNTSRFAAPMNVFAFADRGRLSVLQSNIHFVWALKYCSTMGATIRYTRTDVFSTFPFPDCSALHDVGEKYNKLRTTIMATRLEGLTEIYNRFHDFNDSCEDLSSLRALHIEMDYAVTAAYGWSDLDLGHGFHETKQGIRYTISESARRTVLDRLLALNHQRYEEEVKAGLHDKKAKKTTSGKRGRKAKTDQTEEFDL